MSRHSYARRLVNCSVVFALLVCGTGLQAGKNPDGLLLPEAVVTKTSERPVIDGTMAPGEWDVATSGTGFHVRSRPFERIGHNQSVFWVTYDDSYIYVCFKNYRAPSQRLVRKNARRPDQHDIVGDDSNEIWFTPPSNPQETYQMMFNSYPAVWDVKYVPAVGHRGKGWSGAWEMASTESKAFWVIEARAPIKAFGRPEIRDGSTWRALFTADLLRLKGGKFRRWGPWVTGSFKDYVGHCPLRFDSDSAMLQVLDVESILTGDFNFPLAVTGPADGKSKVTVSVRIGPEVKPTPEDRVLSETVTVADREHRELSIAGNVNGLALPEHEGQPYGVCEITATTGDERTIYSHTFRFMVDGYERRPPDNLLDSPYETAFGVKASHAPLDERLFVRVDRLYLDRRGEVASGRIELIDAETDKTVAQTALEPFRNDYSNTALDIGNLDLPVEDTDAWEKKQAVAEKNAWIEQINSTRGTSLSPLERPGPVPREFQLRVVLRDEGGEELAQVDRSIELLHYRYEWLDHDLGVSGQVIDPWEPLQWDGERITMWNKSYRLGGLGLAHAVRNDGRPQLSGPMRLIAVIDGEKRILRAGRPEMRKLSEAGADLSGTGRAGGLRIDVDTRVEFDGYVRNRMRISPQDTVRLDRLSLVVEMPEEEAPFFCSTAGGWAAKFGQTPDTWTSRGVASGSRMGSFVPYVLLTDSERGFCWFADNDRGWAIDPEGDAVTIHKERGQVVLTVNFVQTPVQLDESREIVYGWMVTPAKPQPAGFRAALIDNGWDIFPKCPWAVFYADFEGRRLWHYYRSPYPTDMEKSRQIVQRKERSRPKVRFCAGKTGNSIGHWEDYKGRDIEVLTADWGVTPGVKANGKVTRSEGPNDYEVWHWDRWIRHSGLRGIYFDINYLSEEWNTLSGTAYKLPNGKVQPGYSFMGQREYLKRLRYLFDEHGKSRPNIWLHSTSGHPVYSWLGDVLMEGENVSPTGPDHDYMDAYPASRFRSIGMGRNIGAAPFVMFQVKGNNAHYPFLGYQFIGWTRAHDVYGEDFNFWLQLAAENQMWREDITFRPYWNSGWGAESTTDGVIVSAHTYPGHALLWVLNTSHESRRAELQIAPEKLGITGPDLRVFDAETSEPLALNNGALTVEVPARLWRAVRLVQPEDLKGSQTFVASFDDGEVAADEALGHRYATGRDVSRATAHGHRGLGVDLGRAYQFDLQHHVSSRGGRIKWRMILDRDRQGTLLEIDSGKPTGTELQKLKISLEEDQLVLAIAPPLEEDRRRPDWQTVSRDKWMPTAGWHEYSVAWDGTQFTLTEDGKPLMSAELPAAVPIRKPPHGIGELRLGTPHVYPARVTFGSIEGAVLDDLVMESASP